MKVVLYTLMRILHVSSLTFFMLSAQLHSPRGLWWGRNWACVPCPARLRAAECRPSNLREGDETEGAPTVCRRIRRLAGGVRNTRNPLHPSLDGRLQRGDSAEHAVGRLGCTCLRSRRPAPHPFPSQALASSEASNQPQTCQAFYDLHQNVTTFLRKNDRCTSRRGRGDGCTTKSMRDHEAWCMVCGYSRAGNRT